MDVKTKNLFLGSAVLALATGTILAMPTTYRNSYSPEDSLPLLEADMDRDAEFQQAMHTFLHNNEHRELRNMLKLAIRILDKDDDSSGEAVFGKNTLDMPFYFDHIKSLVNGEASKSTRRRHRKRSSFDSISHNGGLSGLGGTHRRRKLEFTFENLLPYLIEEMRRNSREIPDTDY